MDNAWVVQSRSQSRRHSEPYRMCLVGEAILLAEDLSKNEQKTSQ